jgi:hypothetical protein
LVYTYLKICWFFCLSSKIWTTFFCSKCVLFDQITSKAFLSFNKLTSSSSHPLSFSSPHSLNSSVILGFFVNFPLLPRYCSLALVFRFDGRVIDNAWEINWKNRTIFIWDSQNNIQSWIYPDINSIINRISFNLLKIRKKEINYYYLKLKFNRNFIPYLKIHW